MTNTDDYDIIANMEDEHDRVCREQIRLALSTYTRDTEHLADEDMDAAAVLCLVAEMCQDGICVGRDEVVDAMNSGYLDLHCKCYYDYETDDISLITDSLVDRGLLEEDDEGLTVAACHRIGKGVKPEEPFFTDPNQFKFAFNE
ncbi:MAG: hypothetical protein HYT73_00860 [Candidatus Aenigmarchaeota archaeon]|nr:hypothetical protein [Candidatus Aenigmarchaeota archaeon]